MAGIFLVIWEVSGYNETIREKKERDKLCADFYWVY